MEILPPRLDRIYQDSSEIGGLNVDSKLKVGPVIVDTEDSIYNIISIPHNLIQRISELGDTLLDRDIEAVTTIKIDPSTGRVVTTREGGRPFPIVVAAGHYNNGSIETAAAVLGEELQMGQLMVDSLDAVIAANFPKSELAVHHTHGTIIHLNNGRAYSLAGETDFEGDLLIHKPIFLTVSGGEHRPLTLEDTLVLLRQSEQMKLDGLKQQIKEAEWMQLQQGV